MSFFTLAFLYRLKKQDITCSPCFKSLAAGCSVIFTLQTWYWYQSSHLIRIFSQTIVLKSHYLLKTKAFPTINKNLYKVKFIFVKLCTITNHFINNFQIIDNGKSCAHVTLFSINNRLVTKSKFGHYLHSDSRLEANKHDRNREEFQNQMCEDKFTFLCKETSKLTRFKQYVYCIIYWSM